MFKKYSKSISFIFGLLFFPILAFAQAPDLSSWQVDTLSSQNLLKANHSNDNWVFVKKDEKILIKQQKEYKKQEEDSLPFDLKTVGKKLNITLGYPYSGPYIKKVRHGSLIGVSHGEFAGGGLYFLSSNGEVSYDIIKYANIHKIFKFNSHFLATGGLAHLGINSGSLLKISRKNKWLWVIDKKIELPESPSVLIFRKNKFYIITSQYIFKVDQVLNVTKVLKSPVYWGMLYPSSAVIEKGDIYIAMRKEIMKIKDFKTNPKYIWYVPEK